MQTGVFFVFTCSHFKALKFFKDKLMQVKVKDVLVIVITSEKLACYPVFYIASFSLFFFSAGSFEGSPRYWMVVG